jgi:hypothetical protein
VTEEALNELEAVWNDRHKRLQFVPGKEAVGRFNQYLQAEYGVSVTSTAIVDAMTVDEIPDEVKNLLLDIAKFAQSKVE